MTHTLFESNGQLPVSLCVLKVFMIVILISIWLRNIATSVGYGYIIHNHKHNNHNSLGNYFHKLYSMYLCSLFKVQPYSTVSAAHFAIKTAQIHAI